MADIKKLGPRILKDPYDSRDGCPQGPFIGFDAVANEFLIFKQSMEEPDVLYVTIHGKGRTITAALNNYWYRQQKKLGAY